jgi:hypothetical protein
MLAIPHLGEHRDDDADRCMYVFTVNLSKSHQALPHAGEAWNWIPIRLTGERTRLKSLGEVWSRREHRTWSVLVPYPLRGIFSSACTSQTHRR